MLAKSQTLIDNEILAHMATERAERNGPLDAEVLDCRPEWHVVMTEPNMEGTAAGHLIGRRFGVYHPQFPVVYISRGRKRKIMRTLFPGYLFVFVWNIRRHVHRIEGCPGVNRLMCHNGRYVVVADKFVDVVRAEENKKSPVLTFSDIIKTNKRPRRRNRYSGPRIVPTQDDQDIQRISAFDAMRDIMELDDAKRIGILHQALGLAS